MNMASEWHSKIVWSDSTQDEQLDFIRRIQKDAFEFGVYRCLCDVERHLEILRKDNIAKMAVLEVENNK